MIKKIILAAALSAALIGQAVASTELGLKYYNMNGYTAAKREFKEPAAKGDPIAQYYFVMLSYTYKKTFAEMQLYKPYIRQSAENGWPYSMWVLGDYGNCKKYDSCSEIQMWRDKALAKWKQMAEKGDIDAAYYYAYYAEGQSDNREQRMQKLALKGNWRAAQYLYDEWNRNDGSSKLSDSDIIKLIKPSSDQGNSLMMAILGRFMEKKDQDAAFELFNESLSKGYTSAAYDIVYKINKITPEKKYYYYMIGAIYKDRLNMAALSPIGKSLSETKKSELKAKAEAFVKEHPPQAFPPIIDTTFLSRDYYGGLSETWDKYFG